MDSVSAQNGSGEPLRALWLGLTLAPAAWFLQLAVGYTLVPMACEHGAVWMLHLTSGVALAFALSGLWIAWRASGATATARQAQAPAPVTNARPAPDRETDGPRTRRTRFMATAGVLLSAFFALTVALAWIPSFLVESCGAH